MQYRPNVTEICLLSGFTQYDHNIFSHWDPVLAGLLLYRSIASVLLSNIIEKTLFWIKTVEYLLNNKAYTNIRESLIKKVYI